MIFSTGMEGGSFVMCDDLCGPPELSFEGAEAVLAGATVPGGGGGNGPFCWAPRVTANKPLAKRNSGLAFTGLLATPTASRVSPCISSTLLDFLFIVIHPRIRCINLHFRGLLSIFLSAMKSCREGNSCENSPLPCSRDAILYFPFRFAISACAFSPPRRKEPLMNIALSDRRVSPRHNFKLPLRVRILKAAIAEQRTESVNLSGG